ncbi:MAG: TIGR02300 family protein [Myxococcales bacterium]|nr:TIGR02300 family protein [Myxococcales bacterium]
MQDKSKLGKRYSCFECSLKFYDLNRPDPLCPKCGADQRTDPNPDPRDAILAKYRGKGAVRARPEDELVEEEAEETEAETEDDEIEDDEEEVEEPVEDE